MALRLDQILSGFKKVDKSTTTSKIIPTILSSFERNSIDPTTPISLSIKENTNEPFKLKIFGSSFLKALTSIRFKFEIEIQILLIVVLGLLSIFLTISIIFKICCLSYFFPKKPKKRPQMTRHEQRRTNVEVYCDLDTRFSTPPESTYASRMNTFLNQPKPRP